jgi:hypothetical protein
MLEVAFDNRHGGRGGLLQRRIGAVRGVALVERPGFLVGLHLLLKVEAIQHPV